jgi:hypothetical protein
LGGEAPSLLFVLDPKILFAGSSLTNAIPAPYFPENGYSLGLSGGSTTTAVALANLSPVKPDVAVVEVTVLHRGIDQTFLDARQGLQEELSVMFPALQPHNKPLTYFTESFFGVSKQRAENFKRFACGRSSDRPEWQESRKKAVKNWAEGKPDGVMLRNALELKREVDKLIAAGTTVYLIDYPVHPDLHETAYAKQIEQAQKQAFPENEYNWLGINTEDLFWYDGLHFEGGSSAFKFVKRVTERIKNDLPADFDFKFEVECG